MFCVICCSFGLIFGQSGSGKTTLLQVDLFLYVFSSEVLYVQFVNTLFFSYLFLSVCPFLSQLLAGLSKPTSGSFYVQKYGNDGKPNGSPEPLLTQRVGIVFQFPERCQNQLVILSFMFLS